MQGSFGCVPMHHMRVLLFHSGDWYGGASCIPHFDRRLTTLTNAATAAICRDLPSAVPLGTD